MISQKGQGVFVGSLSRILVQLLSSHLLLILQLHWNWARRWQRR
jgi:hypothetical protein